MEDWQLIESYLRDKSEAAFKTLVERHAGLVYASALRQVRDATLSQDVAQAVFILLARKAGRLGRGVVLSGWLFQTTRFVALRALRSEHRRHTREQEAFDMQQLTLGDEAWHRLTPIIDEALDRLHRPDRDVILLRFVEGRSLREIGDSLGVSEEAAKKRVMRAVEKLRQLLVRNGVALSTVVIVGALSTHAAAGTPAAVIAALSSNALAATSGVAGTLVSEVLAAWRLTKLKWAGVALLTALVCTVSFWPNGVSSVGTPAQTASAGHESNVATTTTPVLAETAPPSGRPVPFEPDGSRSLRLQVVAADSGEPVTNARVALNTVTDEVWTNRFDLFTDAAGVCRVSFPGNTRRIDVGVVNDGWAARYATWPADGVPEIASEYTLRLPRVSNYIGGIIQDPQGRPLADADISFSSHDAGDSSARERARERFGFIAELAVARTDASGRWRVGFIPENHRGFTLKANHADFPEMSIGSAMAEETGASSEKSNVKWLWANTLVTRMNEGHTLEGTVTDEQGRSIAGATIQTRIQTPVYTTDAAGRFRVPKLPLETWRFTVTAEGFAPVRKEAQVAPGMMPVSIVMQTGAVLRLLVKDESGVGAPGIEVGMEEWGQNRHDFEWKAVTDRDGRIEWLSAPRDVPLELYATSPGHRYTRDVRVVADGREHVIKVQHKLEVHGRVVEEGTGFGVRDFKVMPGSGGRGDEWDLGDTVRGTNGVFKLTLTESGPPTRVRIIAENYEEWTSPPLTDFGPTTVLEIALKKSRPTESVRGVVQLPDGAPASGVMVGLLSFDNDFELRKKKLEGNKRWLRTTGQNGEFAFTVNRLAHSVAAVGEAGFVVARVADPREPVTLRLQPWGRIEGEVAPDAQTHPIQELRLYDPFAQNYQGKVSLMDSYAVKPSPRMRFVFENVPPGEFAVSINSGLGIPFHHLTLVQVSPGETAHVTLRNGPGAVIKGKINLPAGVRFAEYEHVWLGPERESVPYQQLRGEEQKRGALEFWTSPAGRDYWVRQRTFTTKPADNGAFTFREPIPPGQYRLTANTTAGSTATNVVVVEGHSTEIDLGELPFRPREQSRLQ
jgi:RNA polymerase sigma factor (sigma-70 family)